MDESWHYGMHALSLLSSFSFTLVLPLLCYHYKDSRRYFRSPFISIDRRCVCVFVCVCVELLCAPVPIDSFYPLLLFEYDVYPPKKTVLPLRLITFIYHPILLLLLLLYLLMMLIMEISNLNVLVYINEFYFYYF